RAAEPVFSSNACRIPFVKIPGNHAAKAFSAFWLKKDGMKSKDVLATLHQFRSEIEQSGGRINGREGNPRESGRKIREKL
ncbi:MAG: hypothetical protein ACLFRG_08840, partial [Desulfococcaceae bacterium]